MIRTFVDDLSDLRKAIISAHYLWSVASDDEEEARMWGILNGLIAMQETRFTAAAAYLAGESERAILVSEAALQYFQQIRKVWVGY